MLHHSRSVVSGAAILGLFVLAGTTGAQPVGNDHAIAVHSKTVEFTTLSLSHDDLFSVLSRIRRYIASANVGMAADDVADEYLRVSDDGTSFELDLRAGFTPELLKGTPSGPVQISYRYRAYESPNLKSVTLDLTDFSRTLTVSGTSLDHLDGLIGIVSKDLEQHRTYLALSSPVRSGLGGVLIMLGFLLLAASASVPDQRLRVLFAVAGTCVQLSVWFVPWKRWLAGASLYPDTASFVERNAAAIGLIALLLTVVGLLVALFQILQSRHSSRSS